jgi:hypothetical protein
LEGHKIVHIVAPNIAVADAIFAVSRPITELVKSKNPSGNEVGNSSSLSL